MSLPKNPDPAKLVVSCFMNDKACLETVFPLLEDVCGPVDMISQWLDFDYTDYYYKEMGAPLFRKVFAFKNLIAQDALARIKERTNEIESRFEISGKRVVNIDPGYLVSSRFILATGKEYSHRIYIGHKIYADLTLIYSKKEGFKTLEWTYPDYASQSMLSFLSKIRDKYLLDLKASKGKK
ncbi:MAG: DUF4416 family protein [Deltaproteobacteria bacterium]|nr:DUF4416 family protein [Deltaproteobacteria bacterium]